MFLIHCTCACIHVLFVLLVLSCSPRNTLNWPSVIFVAIIYFTLVLNIICTPCSPYFSVLIFEPYFMKIKVHTCFINKRGIFKCKTPTQQKANQTLTLFCIGFCFLIQVCLNLPQVLSTLCVVYLGGFNLFFVVVFFGVNKILLA